jgi:hypothetical protein
MQQKVRSVLKKGRYDLVLLQDCSASMHRFLKKIKNYNLLGNSKHSRLNILYNPRHIKPRLEESLSLKKYGLDSTIGLFEWNNLPFTACSVKFPSSNEEHADVLKQFKVLSKFFNNIQRPNLSIFGGDFNREVQNFVEEGEYTTCTPKIVRQKILISEKTLDFKSYQILKEECDDFEAAEHGHFHFPIEATVILKKEGVKITTLKSPEDAIATLQRPVFAENIATLQRPVVAENKLNIVKNQTKRHPPSETPPPSPEKARTALKGTALKRPPPSPEKARTALKGTALKRPPPSPEKARTALKGTALKSPPPQKARTTRRTILNNTLKDQPPKVEPSDLKNTSEENARTPKKKKDDDLSRLRYLYDFLESEDESSDESSDEYDIEEEDEYPETKEPEKKGFEDMLSRAKRKVDFIQTSSDNTEDEDSDNGWSTDDD